MDVVSGQYVPYTCGNALLPGSYPEDGSIVGSVTRRVLQDGFAAPRHRL
jgi:hypothetical protein